jgi:hypothetical protein
VFAVKAIDDDDDDDDQLSSDICSSGTRKIRKADRGNKSSTFSLISSLAHTFLIYSQKPSCIFVIGFGMKVFIITTLKCLNVRLPEKDPSETGLKSAGCF